MKDFSEQPSDPRVRRTRRLLQDALQELIKQKPFPDVSVTDICKQADIARVTFYQHYDSKEALLLAAVADFFASLYQSVNLEAIDAYLKTGSGSGFSQSEQTYLADPNRITLVGIALQYVGSDVRKLSIPPLVAALQEQESELTTKQLEVLATFYIGGVLTLLEQFLQGGLSLSPSEFQETTLPFLRVLREGMINLSILSSD